MRSVFPRCGSTDPEHRSKLCTACKTIYNRRYRGAQQRQALAERLPCFACGLARGNSLGVGVYTYALQRTVYPNGSRASKRTVNIASLTLCDRCLPDYALPSPAYMRANGLTQRKWPERRAA